MSDSKYGYIFTEEDVEKALEYTLMRFDQQYDIDLDTRGEFDLDKIMQEVMEGKAGQLKFPTDEPLFVLRARDRRALAAVRSYRDNQHQNAPINHTEGIERAVRAFEKFRVEHDNLMREPD